MATLTQTTPRAAPPLAEELQWWEVWGTYCGALVAAASSERAMELIQGYQSSDRWRGVDEAQEPTPPGPPPAEGIYFWYAE